MKSFISASLATLIAVTTALPATTQPAEARNRGAKIAAGVLLGAAALAIIGSSGRARAQDQGDAGTTDEEEADSQELNRRFRQCQKWQQRCENGRRSACDQHEAGCSDF